MSKESWHKGYQEVKNVIHNDMGVTKEEILEVFRQIAKDEVRKIISDSKPFIYTTIREVIRHEMADAVKDHRYPEIAGSTRIFGYMGKGEKSFEDYISGVMKEEIITELRKQFSFDLNIEQKD
jgi:hypothetical protein